MDNQNTDNMIQQNEAQQPDQNTTSLDLMNRMKMHGMAEAFRESLAGTTAQSMTPDSFLSMLLHREWDWRAQAAVTRLTKNVAFRYKAYPEEINYATGRSASQTVSFSRLLPTKRTRASAATNSE